MAEGGKNQPNVALSLPPPPIFGTISHSSATDGEHKHPGGPISLDDIFDSDFIFDKMDSKSKMNSSNVGMGVASSGASSSGSGRAMGSGAADVMDDRGDDGYDSMLDDDDDDDDEDGDGRKKKRARGLNKNMTEEQKVERRFVPPPPPPP